MGGYRGRYHDPWKDQGLLIMFYIYTCLHWWFSFAIKNGRVNEVQAVKVTF